MGRRHFKYEQIIHMLREAEIKLAGGKTTGEVCRELGISEQSYYRWREENGGMQVSQARYLIQEIIGEVEVKEEPDGVFACTRLNTTPTST
jgi:transposase-like protein